MNSLIQTPLEVQLLPNNRILVVNNTTLLLSLTYCIQKSLQIPLQGKKPYKSHYSPQQQQILIVTTTTIQVYHSDWYHLWQTRKIILLFNQPIWSIQYNQDWILYGRFFQYGNQRVKFIKVWNRLENSCFVGGCEYAIEDKMLFKIIHSDNRSWKKQVMWKERFMVIGNLRDSLCLAGMQNTANTILCIGQMYILILKNDKIIKTIERNHVFYFQNNIIVSGLGDFRVDRINNNNIQQLGITQAPAGILYAAAIEQQRLVLMQYYLNSLRPKGFKLIVTQSPDKKTLQPSADKIIVQEANQSGSLLINPLNHRYPSMKQQKKNSQMKQLDQQMQGMAASDHDHENSPTEKHHFNMQNDQIPKRNYQLMDSIKLQQSYEQRAIKKQNQNEQEIDEVQLQEISVISYKQGGDAWAQFMNKQRQYQQPHKDNLKVEDPQNPTHLKKIGQLAINTKVYRKRSSLSQVIAGSQKVQAFFMGRTITPELRDQIQSQKYSQLLMQMMQVQPESFNQCLERFLSIVIQEDESVILFSYNIRQFNPNDTKQRLRQLYKNLLDNRENRYKFCKALRDFKLCQVPIQCIPLPQNITNLLNTLNCNLFMIDILEPSLKLYADLLEQYLIKEELSIDQIRVEDEYINIEHPRNFLNIILYLNETFQIPIADVFSIYINKILKYGHVDIIRKLIHEEQQVLNICEVQLSTVQKSIQQFIFSLLKQTCMNMPFVYEVISLLDGQVRQSLQKIHFIIESFNQNEINFSVIKLFDIRQNKSLKSFIEYIIKQNPARALVNFDIALLYQRLWQLQQKQKLFNYTYQLVYLISILSEKLLESQFYVKSFYLLDTVSLLIKRGFLAKLLINYMDGKYLNRLINLNLNQKSLKQVFPQFFVEDLIINQLKNDQYILPVSQMFSCNFQQFSIIFNKVRTLTSQILKIIVYLDLNLAAQLVQYEIIKQQQLNALLNQMKKYLLIKIPKVSQKNNTPQLTNIQISSFIEEQSNYQNNNIESHWLKIENKITQSLVYLKKQEINSFDAQKPRSFCKDNSSQKLQRNDPDLAYLFILVEENDIISALKDIYNDKPKQKFLKAVAIAEKQKIQLYNVEIYKQLISLGLQYNLDSLLPFEIFQKQNRFDVFVLIKVKIQEQINIHNFWVLFLIIDIFIGQGYRLAEILIQKIIKIYKNDQYSSVVEYLINTHSINKMFLRGLKYVAKKNNLNKIYSIL